MSFQDYVKAVAKTPIKFPQLRACMLAQSIMEGGREDTDLARLHNNHHGLKFRTEMQGYATPVDYYTDSEPTGHDIFCKFASKEAEVIGYWKFISRAPYAGFEAHTATPRDYLNYIGPTYCPPGFTKEWAKKHGGLNYTEYIVQKLLPEAEELLAAYKEEEPPMTAASWFNISTDKGPAVQAMAGSTVVETLTGNSVKALIALLQKHEETAGTWLVGPRKEGTTPVEPPKPPTGTKKTTFFLDPGHSNSKPGARSNDGRVREEKLNQHAAALCQKILEANGYKTLCWDPDPDNLTAVGQKARGFDVAISFHNNQYKNGTGNPYHCIMVDPAMSSASKQITSRLALAIGRGAKGTIAETKVFEGTNGLLGVYEAELSVLNASWSDPDGKPPFHILPEFFFLNKFTDEEACKKAMDKIIPEFTKQLMVEFPA